MNIETCKCELCSIVASNRHNINKICDTLLFESENFYSIASLGALVPGWVLVIPKNHVICMGALSYTLVAEYQIFSNTIRSNIESIYGPTITFEHGPAKKGLTTGCSVDHAHLHIVPLRGEIEQFVQRYLPPHSAYKTDCYNDLLSLTADIHTSGKSYITLSLQQGEQHLFASEDFPSQVVRRAIADHLSIPEQYSWRQHAFEDNVEETILTIRSHFGNCDAGLK